MKFSTKLIFSYFGFTLLATILIGVFLYSFEIEDQEKLHWMGIALILFASALLSLMVVANRLIKPIILLKEAVIKLGQGDFNITVPVLSQDEIGELSQAFNRMAQLLRENVTELSRVQQITETAHDNLYETNERFQAIFESVTDCILVWDKDYIYLYANQAALDYIHKTSEQVIGKTITQLFAEFPEFAQLWMERINQVFLSGQPLKVEDSTFSGGRIAYSESILSPIKDRQDRVFAVSAVYRDVTERKRAEESLILFRMLAESAAQGMAIGTLSEGKIVYTNPAILQLLGKDMNQYSFFHFYPDQFLERLKSEVLPAVLEKGQWFGETILNTTSGQRVPVLENIYLIRDETGKPLYLANAITDITERKCAETQLEETNRVLNEFKTTLDMTFDAVYMIDASTLKFLYANQGAMEQLGYTQEEFLQMKVLDINQTFDETSFRQHIAPLSDGSKSALTFETTHQHKNGTTHPVEVVLQKVRVEGQKGKRFVAIARDITERKRTEEALQRSQKQFRQLLAMLRDGIVITDLNGNIVEFNPSYQRMIGYDAEEIYQLTYQKLTPPKWAEMEQKIVEERILPLGYSELYEKEYIRKDGIIIPIEVGAYLIKDDQGHPVSLWGIVRDITERKQAEQQLQQAKNAAEMANQAKSTFLANMSHELRTPLNAVLGYAQILMRDKTVAGKQREGIEIIQRSGEYLLTLINDILDLSKIEAGKVELYPIDFNFDEFIRGITELFQIRAQQKGIAFIYEPLSYLPRGIRADDKRLRQILINLLGNAIKFTDHGGVSLKIGYQDEKIRFQVEDTGPGIASEDLDKIFSPFHQAGNQAYKAEGTGLGLAITKTLVEMMGGELQVKSTLGHGSTFWFALELMVVSDLVKPKKVREPIIVGFAGKPLTILVIDDRWENRSVMVNLLGPLGFEVVEAHNGKEGLEKAIMLCPDLIVTDLVMPVMDGFEATRKIRQVPELINTPIIAASASVFDYHQQESFEAGCNAFIPKPFRAEVLLELLREHLDLTWVYEDEKETEAMFNQEVTESAENAPLVGPTAEQAAVLYDLAMMGDISGILQKMDEFEHSNKQLALFSSKIKQLAKGFEEEKICELLEQYQN